VRDIEVRVGGAGTALNGLCSYHPGPITPARSAYMTCSDAVWGRFVRVQRITPDYVDYLDFCEVKIDIKESKSQIPLR